MSEPPVPGAAIVVRSVPNLRDLGGCSPTVDGGAARRGLVTRSTELHELADSDVPRVAGLGLEVVYDLRTQDERRAKPDRVLDGVDTVVLDVLADYSSAAPAKVLAVLDDPAAAEELLGAGKAAQLFTGAYQALITLPSARTGYHRLFTDLADPQQGPVLFHCTTGKDRTGWAAAALLLLLGVDQDDVVDDYLLTNDQLLPHLQPVFDRFAAAGGNPSC